MDYYPWKKNQDHPAIGEDATSIATRQQPSGSLIVRSAGATPMDLGSQVGARRHLEFSAGQRSHRISMGSYTKA